MTTTLAPLQFSPGQILEFDTLSGTNDYMKQVLLSGEMPEGTVVWTKNQTHGRGQFNNEWLCEPGKNITLSVLLKPRNLAASEAFRLSKVMALAVFKTVSQFVNNKVSIKWPNDIFVDDHKISGILIENAIQGEFVKQSVVGIGINVNQGVFLSDNNPTSMFNLSGNSFELREVVEVLLSHISREYLQLQSKNYKIIEADYFQRLHKVYTEQTFYINGELKAVTINDVQPDGSIVLTIDGKKSVYLHNEARWKI